MKRAVLARGRGSSGVDTVRMSITLESDKANLIEQLAREKKVSSAWVIRDAVDNYLERQWPLLSTE